VVALGIGYSHADEIRLVLRGFEPKTDALRAEHGLTTHMSTTWPSLETSRFRFLKKSSFTLSGIHPQESRGVVVQDVAFLLGPEDI
jgi:hypothetical protein